MACQQKFGQFNAHAPTTGKFTSGALEIFTIETKTGERAFDFRVVVLRAHHLQTIVFATESFDEFHVFRRFIVRSTRKFVVQTANAITQFVNVRKCFFDLGSHGCIVAEYHHLRQVSHTHVALYRNATVRGRLQTGQDFEHRALACAIFAHKRNAIALVDYKTHVREQGTRRKFNF